MTSEPFDFNERLRDLARLQTEVQVMDKEVIGREHTPEERARIIGLVRQCQSAGLSNAQIAALAKVREPSVDRLLKGEPFKNAGSERSVLHALARLSLADISKVAKRRKESFVRTGIVLDIHARIDRVIRMCRKGSTCMGVIVGQAGSGKSTALKGIRDFYPGAIYLQITNKMRTLRTFHQHLATALGIRNVKGYASGYLADRIYDELRGTYRLLLLDELHRIGDLNVLNSIRDLMDETECPIILCGQPKLLTILEDSRRDRSLGATIVRRIGVKLNLDELVAARPVGGSDDEGGPRWKVDRQLLYGPDEVRAVIEKRQLKLRIDPQALALLVYIANHPDGGMLGTVMQLLDNAEDTCLRKSEQLISLDRLMQELREMFALPEFVHVLAAAPDELMNKVRRAQAAPARRASAG